MDVLHLVYIRVFIGLVLSQHLSFGSWLVYITEIQDKKHSRRSLTWNLLLGMENLSLEFQKCQQCLVSWLIAVCHVRFHWKHWMSQKALFVPPCLHYRWTPVVSVPFCFAENTENWGCSHDANDGWHAHGSCTCSGELLNLHYNKFFQGRNQSGSQQEVQTLPTGVEPVTLGTLFAKFIAILL